MKAGSAMHDLLEPFHACQQRLLTAVLHHDSEGVEPILLTFGADALASQSDPDLDTLTVSFRPLAPAQDFIDISADRSWAALLENRSPGGWLTTNQQGYIDGALVSFNGVLPEVGVTVVASALKTVLLTRVDR